MVLAINTELFLGRAVLHRHTLVGQLIDDGPLGALAASHTLLGAEGLGDGAVRRTGRATGVEELANHGTVCRDK